MPENLNSASHRDNIYSDQKSVKINLNKNISYYPNKFDQTNGISYDVDGDNHKNESTNNSNKLKCRISDIESTHVLRSQAGIHLQINSITLSLDTNTHNPHTHNPQNTHSMSINSGGKKGEKIEKNSFGTGLCIEMKKLNAKMFFKVPVNKRKNDNGNATSLNGIEDKY